MIRPGHDSPDLREAAADRPMFDVQHRKNKVGLVFLTLFVFSKFSVKVVEVSFSVK